MYPSLYGSAGIAQNPAALIMRKVHRASRQTLHLGMAVGRTVPHRPLHFFTTRTLFSCRSRHTSPEQKERCHDRCCDNPHLLSLPNVCERRAKVTGTRCAPEASESTYSLSCFLLGSSCNGQRSDRIHPQASKATRASSGNDRACVFRIMEARWFSTVLWLMPRSAAIFLLGWPVRTISMTSRSRFVRTIMISSTTSRFSAATANPTVPSISRFFPLPF